MNLLRERMIAAEAKAGELLSVRKEKDQLNTALTKANSTIAQLQEQLAHHDEASQDALHELQKQFVSLQHERDQLAMDLSSSIHQIEDVSNSLLHSETENKRLQQIVDEFEHSRALRDESATLASLTKSKELDALKSQLHEVSEQKKQLVAEQVELSQRCLKTQEELGKVTADLDAAATDCMRLDTLRNQWEQKAKNMETELDLAKADRSRLQSRLNNLEKSWSDNSGNQSTLEEVARECDTLRQELILSRQKCSEQDEELRSLRKDLSGTTVYADQNASLLSKVEEMEAKLHTAVQDRVSLDKMAAEYEQRLEEICQQLESISRERDELLKERSMLEEENEEMLVQFGLLKEDMDATDAYVEQLEASRIELDQSAQNSLRELQETKRRLHDLTAGLELGNKEAQVAAEVAMDNLNREKEELFTSVQELSQRNQSMEATLKAIESEKADMTVCIATLQRQISEFTEDRLTKESRLIAVIEDLEGKNQDLCDTNHVQEKTISELQASLSRSDDIGKDADNLRLRVTTLEQSLSDAHRHVQQKDSEIHDLRDQLASAGKKPAESAELETLRRTVREMDDSAERDRSHIQELEQLSDETARELRKAKDRLLASENLASQLRNDLEARRHKEREIEELQERLTSTERRLEQANQDTNAFRAESTDLRGNLMTLEAELEDYRRSSQQPAKEPSGQSSAELQSLRQQIEMLKQHQIASSSQTGAREESIEREVHLLQQQMRQKDSEIGKLQSQLQSLDSDLSNKHKELESKQEHVDKLSSELKDLRSQSMTDRTLDLTRDEAENSEKMRQQIVALAKALERSEGQRALVIERLEGERQANADSLRRLTESVKRFYSTLSMGDT